MLPFFEEQLVWTFFNWILAIAVRMISITSITVRALVVFPRRPIFVADVLFLAGFLVR